MMNKNEGEFSSIKAQGILVRMLELTSVEPFTTARMAEKLEMNQRTLRNYLAYLRTPGNRQLRIADYEKTVSGARVPLYASLAAEDAGPLLPDVSPPPAKQKNPNSVSYFDRLKQTDAPRRKMVASEASSTSPIQPFRDPFVAALFGNAYR